MKIKITKSEDSSYIISGIGDKGGGFVTTVDTLEEAKESAKLALKGYYLITTLSKIAKNIENFKNN